MPCNCSKNKNGEPVRLAEHDIILSKEKWGPILWNYMHCIAEKIGQSGNKIVDTDQANYMETLLTMLPLILPCKECQVHAATYIASTPIPVLRGLYNVELRSTVRGWLFLFHNTVRASNSQPIIVETIEDCQELYAVCSIPKCDYTHFIQSVAAAVRQGWVRIDHWRKWYSNSERIRILSGNVVI